MHKYTFPISVVLDMRLQTSKASWSVLSQGKLVRGGVVLHGPTLTLVGPAGPVGPAMLKMVPCGVGRLFNSNLDMPGLAIVDVSVSTMVPVAMLSVCMTLPFTMSSDVRVYRARHVADESGANDGTTLFT